MVNLIDYQYIDDDNDPRIVKLFYWPILIYQLPTTTTTITTTTTTATITSVTITTTDYSCSIKINKKALN